MRRVFVSVVLALMLLGTLIPAADAAPVWCDDEPPVTIVTPGGNTVVVHVTNYGLGLEHLKAVQSAFISPAIVRPVEHGRATRVEIYVLIPGDKYDLRFKTRSVVTMDVDANLKPIPPFLAQAEGRSGQFMRLRFTLNVP